ncbi:MAG: hypothetical protein ABR530_08020, partial [Pyrinomonadaceae bacterium]
MEIYFQLVTDGESLKKACDDLKTQPFLGFDVETTHLDPYKGDLRLVQLSDGKNTKVIDLKPFREKGDLRKLPELAPLRDLLASTRQTMVAHNAKFDTKWVRHHLGIEVGSIYDTYLASVLVAAGVQLNVRLVHALRGKSARAEPIALKFETGRAFFA